MFIIAGIYRRQHLKVPKGNQTRPTANRLREALFNICQQAIEEASFLDIFAGSGAMGLEALSRGAQSAVFIDMHKEAIRCIKDNIASLKVENQCQVLVGEAFAMLQLLERQGKTFDIIYADPPYHTSSSSHAALSAQMIQWLDTHALLAPGGLLFIEEDFRFQPHLEQLQTLKLINTRRMGLAALQQYQRN